KLLVVALLAWGVTLSNASIGFDASEEISVSQFMCMNNTGYQYYMARISKSNGQIDTIGIQNLKNANQLTSLAFLYSVDAYLSPCFGACSPPVDQITTAIKAVADAKAWYTRLWIDVKNGDWPVNQIANQQTILDMINQSASLGGYGIGIYTDMDKWQKVTGNWDGARKYPLWWANNNTQPNFKNFQPFGGWTSPTMHQYTLGTSGACSMGNLNLNWSP
ncbi:hypothetical protein PFISCL1PPCAC_29018, partial [Pristionchus fissidentatus]